MVRVNVGVDEFKVDRWPEPPRQLPVCIAHRNGTPNQTSEPPFGCDDMPTKISGEWHVSKDGRYREWVALASAYELQQMMVWSSYKAMLCMKSINDMHEVGLRVGLALARENPDYWP